MKNNVITHPRLEEAQRVALPWLDAEAIFAPLPPVPYVLGALDICPGAPALVAGYGYSGKTMALQSMALSVACGIPAWGTYAVAQGRVAHVDYEQGERLTRERYQRLARGLMVGPSDIGDRLRLTSTPQLYLDGTVAEDVLAHELDGCTLAIVDSLRAAAPTIEENSSDVRRTLDMLGRVSSKTGCSVIVIHHARKPAKDAAGGAKMAIRGSGAIFDACSSVLVFEAAKGMPITITHEKARTSGRTVEDFHLSISDVPNGGDERWGVVVSAEAAPLSAPSTLETCVSELVNKHPGLSGRQLAAFLPETPKARVYEALSRLEVAGQVEGRPGPNRSMTWWPSVSGTPS